MQLPMRKEPAKATTKGGTMTRRFILFTFAVVLATMPAQTQEKTTLVVHAFSVPTGVQWPYDTKQLQLATVAELKAKCGTRAEVVTETPENRTKVLILEG